MRPDFHPGHHEAVGELPGPESCHRGQYDARHLSEHGFISALPAPVLRRRQLHDDKAHEGHEQGGGKTCPNAPPRPSIAIRSEKHTSELQSLIRLSEAVSSLIKKKSNKKKS